jgi:hypothetical protein
MKMATAMVKRAGLIFTLLFALALLGGCGGGNAPAIDPCITNPNLAGCNPGDTSGSISIDRTTAPIVASNTLNDLLDITQIALVAVIKSYDYKTEIQTVDQSVQEFPVYTLNDPSTAPFQHTLNCDNNNTYNVAIQDFKPPNIMEGKTVSITFNNVDVTGHPNPELTCQFGSMNLRGFFHLTRITITEDPNQPGSWSLDGELWPTITIHDGNYRAFVSNPIHILADYAPDTGLSFTGTVMDSSTFSSLPLPNGTTPNGNNFIDGIGMIFTHYPAGSDPNTSPNTTYDVLQKDFVITAQLDSIDPATASLLSLTTDGTLVNNITGTDLYLNIHTHDSSNTPVPLTWSKPDAYDLDPKGIPPFRGSYLIEDTGTGSSVLTTIDTANASTHPGKLFLTVVDNTLPPSDPAQTATLDSYWQILMKHLGQPGVI